jgi:hypothetical protein
MAEISLVILDRDFVADMPALAASGDRLHRSPPLALAMAAQMTCLND